MKGYCLTGQRQQQAVVAMEEKEVTPTLHETQIKPIS